MLPGPGGERPPTQGAGRRVGRSWGHTTRRSSSPSPPPPARKRGGLATGFPEETRKRGRVHPEPQNRGPHSCEGSRRGLSTQRKRADEPRPAGGGAGPPGLRGRGCGVSARWTLVPSVGGPRKATGHGQRGDRAERKGLGRAAEQNGRGDDRVPRPRRAETSGDRHNRSTGRAARHPPRAPARSARSWTQQAPRCRLPATARPGRRRPSTRGSAAGAAGCGGDTGRKPGGGMAVYGTTGLLHTSTVARPPSSLPEQGPRGAFHASETTFQRTRTSAESLKG